MDYNNLKEVMIIENIDVKKLSEASNVSLNTLEKIIKKRKSISPKTQKKIIIGLNKLTDKNHFGFEIFKKSEKKLINELKTSQKRISSYKENLNSIKEEKIDLEKNLFTASIKLDDLEQKLEDYNLSNIESYRINIPKSIKTAFQQYLLFFKDYVENTKNQELYFEVVRTEEGLRIDVDNKEIELDEITEWFHEYLSFFQVADNKRTDVLDLEKSKVNNLFVEELKTQIIKLESTLELLKTKNQLLIEEQRFLKNLTLNLTTKESRIKDVFKSQKDDLKLDIANGEIESVLGFLLKNLKDDTLNYDLVISSNFRYNQLKNEKMKGTINNADSKIELNQITNTILEIINKI